MASHLVARTIRRIEERAIWTDKAHTSDYLIATINYYIPWAGSPLSVMDIGHNGAAGQSYRILL